MIPVVPQKNTLFYALVLANFLVQTPLQPTMLFVAAYHGRRWKHPIIERQERQFRCCERQWVDDLIRIPVFKGVDVCIQRVVARCVDSERESAQLHQLSTLILLCLPYSPADLEAIEDGKYSQNQKRKRNEVVIETDFLCEDDAAIESVDIIRWCYNSMKKAHTSR